MGRGRPCRDGSNGRRWESVALQQPVLLADALHHRNSKPYPFVQTTVAGVRANTDVVRKALWMDLNAAGAGGKKDGKKAMERRRWHTYGMAWVVTIVHVSQLCCLTADCDGGSTADVEDWSMMNQIEHDLMEFATSWEVMETKQGEDVAPRRRTTPLAHPKRLAARSSQPAQVLSLLFKSLFFRTQEQRGRWRIGLIVKRE
jgi:hypothetical protein